MNLLSIFICAVSAVNVFGAEPTMIGPIIEVTRKYQSECQEALKNNQVSLLNVFSGDVTEEKACFMYCLLWYMVKREKTSKQEIEKVRLELEDKCGRKLDCKGFISYQYMMECLEKSRLEDHVCAKGKQMLQCAKKYIPNLQEEINKHL